MKTIYKVESSFGAAPMKREGEWVSYDAQTHRRHIVTHDTVTTLDNKEVHHGSDFTKRTFSGITTSA